MTTVNRKCRRAQPRPSGAGQSRSTSKADETRTTNSRPRTCWRGLDRAGPKKDTVDLSDGYQNNIHVLIVSRRFDGMSEKDKQDVLWRVIDATELTIPEKALISLVYPVSPAEVK